MTNKAGHEFWVIMQKRRDGEVYADLHKTNQIIYFTYEDALKDFNDDDPDFKGYYHIVKMIARLDEEEPNEVLLNTLIEFE